MELSAGRSSSLPVFARQESLSGSLTGMTSLTNTLFQLRCHYNDQVFTNSSSSGQPVPSFACKFCQDGNYGNLLAVVDEEGSVKLLDTEVETQHSIVMEWNAHKNAIFDVSWVGSNKMVTGSGDCTIVLWDTPSGRSLSTFKGHHASVKSVNVHRVDQSMVVSGSRDGNILVWDTRCSTKGSFHKPANSIYDAHHPQPQQSSKRRRSEGSSHGVTAALFHHDNKLISAGASDGVVKMWDLRRTYSHITSQPPPCWYSFSLTDTNRAYGFTSLVADTYQSCVYASCTDHIIYMFDTVTLQQQPARLFTGLKNSSFYVKSALSPEGRYLLSGSSCGSGYVWDVMTRCCSSSQSPLLSLTGHNKEVTAVAWSPYLFDRLVTCTDDCDIRVWRRPAATAGHSYVGFAEQHREGSSQLVGTELEARSLSVETRSLLGQTSPSRAPLLALENNGVHAGLGELLANLPSCLDSDNKLLPFETNTPSHKTTPTSSRKATPTKGLLDYWSPSSVGTRMSCKRPQTTSSSLPELKRQRRCNGVTHQRQASSSSKRSPPTKTNVEHHKMISDYLISNSIK